MFADLHLHTQFSDGTYSPEELAVQARRHELAAIALTDHDTVEGCERARQACEAAGMEFIAGTELTAEQEGNELHILGYMFDTHDPKLLEEITRFQSVRQNRIRFANAGLLHQRIFWSSINSSVRVQNPTTRHF